MMEGHVVGKQPRLKKRTAGVVGDSRALQVVISTNEGSVVAANRAFCRTLGWKPEEAMGKKLVALGGNSTGARRQIQAGDGTLRMLDVRSQGFDMHGEQVVVSVVEEVSRRQEAPQEWALLERVLDGSPIGIFVLDRELRFLRVNSKAARMFGIEEQEQVGRQISEVLPEMFSELSAILPKIIGGGGPRVAVETSAPNSSGNTTAESILPRLYLAYYYPLESPSGGMIGVGCMFIDITEQREAEGALRDSEVARHTILGQMLRVEESERSRLALELHDDTIQVLCALLLLFDGMIPIAKRAGQTEISERLDGARLLLSDATERARKLMFELHPSVLHERGLQTATRSLVDQVSEAIGAAGTVDVPKNRYAWALEELTYRVIREALSNVRKHSNATNFAVTVTDANGQLTGAVTDDGEGFTNGGDPSRRAPHHLGVEAMKERAQLAGGVVKITSAKGKGTRVAFSFPVDQRDEGWHTRDPRPDAESPVT
jgi:two-component system, NarL family, sensor histidine kinase UhpB